MVHGQCVALGDEGLPYAPIAGALRELTTRGFGRDRVLAWAGPSRAGPRQRAAAELVPVSGEAGGELGEAATLRGGRPAAGAGEVAVAPLVVVLEDVHWADESTRHLLRFLAGALTDAAASCSSSPFAPTSSPGAIRCVPSCGRAGPAAADHAAGRARPRPRDGVGHLVDAAARLPPQARGDSDLVHQRSEGIPYFVEELAGLPPRGGAFNCRTRFRDALSVAGSRHCPAAAQGVLDLISVAGVRVGPRRCWRRWLRMSADELEGGLREAVDGAVLRADESGYVFRHALLREVVHEDLLPGQHARLHGRFAAVLEARRSWSRPEAAPWRSRTTSAPRPRGDKAFDWSIRAAAARRGGFPEALKMYERALELWDRVARPGGDGRAARDGVGAGGARRPRTPAEPERALASSTQALVGTPAGPSGDLARRTVREEPAALRALCGRALSRPGAAESWRCRRTSTSRRRRSECSNQLVHRR